MERILQEYAAGVPASVLCRTHGVPKSTLYAWLGKTTETGSVNKDRLQALKTENKRLKLLLADGVLQLIFDQATIGMDHDFEHKLKHIRSLADEDVKPPTTVPEAARHPAAEAKSGECDIRK